MKRLLSVIVAVAVVGVGVGAYYRYGRAGVEPQVATLPVTTGSIVESVGATGSLESLTTVQVGSQVSGSIQELKADFNSLVKKGQVIARLDPSLFQTQIEQARANLARAQADAERLRVALADAEQKLRRAKELSARSLIPATELETAEVNVDSAEAQLKSSQAQITQAQASLNQNQVNLEHTVITAPIDGIVISRNVDVGQTVAASMQAPTLFVIAADLTKMKCTANIDEADVGKIRPGQHVRFRVDAYATEEFDGTVSQIRLQPTVVQNVVTYGTVIDVPNPQLKLKPGMTANVTIEIARRDNATRLPSAALRFRPTTETFAALNQSAPPELQRGMGFGGGQGQGPGGAGGRGPDGDASPSAPAAAGSNVPGSQPSPATSARPAPRTSTPPSGAGAAGQDATARPGRGGRQGGGDGPSGRFDSTGGSENERRQRMMERLQSVPTEERERMIARMRERGFDPGQLSSPAPANGGGAGPTAPPPRLSSGGSNQDLQRGGATTIDALFGPLEPTVSFGRVWVFANGQLKPVRVRLGISDGTYTELLSGELQPNAEVVTSVTTGLETRRPNSGGGANSPFMPGPPRGMPGGGGGGGRGPGGGPR